MTQRLELEGGGYLEYCEEGAQVRCFVRRGMDGAGLYKVWLHGSETDLLLGTLIPEGGWLKLRRTVSRDTLERAGCWPILGGKTALSFSFSSEVPRQYPSSWRWDHRPALRFSDSILAEAAAAVGPMLLRETAHGFQLAAPFDPKRPFPIPMLFCLARIDSVDGRFHAVFSFAADGTPRTEP